MPKYVTRMAKSGESESYAVKDATAHQMINEEVTARGQAVAAEATARGQAVAAEATAREQAVAAEATAREQAVAAEADARETDISNLKNIIKLVDPQIQNGKRILINGTIDTSVSIVSMSKEISLKAGEMITFTVTHAVWSGSAVLAKVIISGEKYEVIERGKNETGYMVSYYAMNDCEVVITSDTEYFPNDIMIRKIDNMFSVSLSMVNNRRIRTDGIIDSPGGVSHSQGIELFPGDIIRFTVSVPVWYKTAMLSEVIEENSKYKPLIGGQDAAGINSYEADHHCMVAICADDGKISNVCIYRTATINQATEEMYGKIRSIYPSYVQNYRILADGSLEYNADFAYSDPIALRSGEEITFQTSNDVWGGIAVLAKVVSQNLEYDPIIKGISGSPKIVRWVADDDCSVSISMDKVYTPLLIYVRSAISYEKKNTEDPGLYCMGTGIKEDPYVSKDGYAGIKSLEKQNFDGCKSVKLDHKEYQIHGSAVMPERGFLIEGKSMSYQTGRMLHLPSSVGSRITLKDENSHIEFNESYGNILSRFAIWGKIGENYSSDFPTLFDPSAPEKNCAIIIKNGHFDQNKFHELCIAGVACGIYIEGDVDASIFDNINFDGCNTGIIINPSNNNFNICSTFKNCIFADMPGMGLLIKGISRSFFINNMFSNIGGYTPETVQSFAGYNCVNYIKAQLTSIKDNILFGQGRTDKIMYGSSGYQEDEDCYALVIDGNYNDVSGNTIRDSVGYGLLIAGSNNIVRGNNIGNTPNISITITGNENIIDCNKIYGGGGTDKTIIINGDRNLIFGNYAEQIIINGDNNKAYGNIGEITDNGNNNIIE